MSIPDARYIRGRTLRLASSNVNLYDSLIHMEVEKRQELSEYNQGGMQSLELLDLLFDCQDGILRHEYSPAESIWAASGTNISTQENEAFVSPLLLPADSPLDSNLWSPAASDSGISEDAHSDHQNSPFQYQFVDACYVTSNLRDFPEQDLCMNLGGHADIWTGLICNGNNPKSQPQISDIPLTVKDLLLSSSFDMQASTLPQNGHNTGTCGELVLTEDERKLLSKEGVVLPTQLPLTKHEERVLKRIRRKIRNKQSAQESRKKKKEYMDGLEMRMSACAAQNQELQRKVLQLEKHNMSLLEQLRKLQALVSHSAGKATQTSTCVAVLLLSFSLLIFPTMNQFARNKIQEGNDFLPVRVFSRSLHNPAYSRVFHFPSESEDMAHWGDPDSQTHNKEVQSRRKSLDVDLPNRIQQFIEKDPKGTNYTRMSTQEKNLQFDESTAKILSGSVGDSVAQQIIMSWKEPSKQEGVANDCDKVKKSNESI
ncbi:cyclic AMP-responsive element-binding protein 3-like protein 3 isoform X1 [Aquarana catesbeiana]|uniref:cyclic AMP-responsive element-binding protein 3-like protein 3 isoform X1 n=1 Tax=Aquarana catesbeiana TaxID=8400 RepID=UPI003CC9C13A